MLLLEISFVTVRNNGVNSLRTLRIREHVTLNTKGDGLPIQELHILLRMESQLSWEEKVSSQPDPRGPLGPLAPALLGHYA
jgi:hypothetical protein